MANRKCSVEGCDNRHNSHGYCRKHLYRWKRYGDPLFVKKIVGDIVARFWHYADDSAGPDACWPWTGKIHESGYGLIKIDGRWLRAHRFSYEMAISAIPKSIDLDHTCHVPETCSGGVSCIHRRCVNPAHLRPVTNAENHRAHRVSSNERKKTHCPQGHEYTADNIKRIPSNPNARFCRECHRISERKRYARKRAERARSSAE